MKFIVFFCEHIVLCSIEGRSLSHVYTCFVLSLFSSPTSFFSIVVYLFVPSFHPFLQPCFSSLSSSFLHFLSILLSSFFLYPFLLSDHLLFILLSFFLPSIYLLVLHSYSVFLLPPFPPPPASGRDKVNL